MSDEWVMVPREPTAVQLIDGAYAVPDPISHRGELTARMVYRAMLDAAPTSPMQAEPVAWFDPTNKSPRQAVTFSKADRDEWPHIYSAALYTCPPAAEVQRLREALKPFAAIDLTTNQAVDAMDVLRARRALGDKA